MNLPANNNPMVSPPLMRTSNPKITLVYPNYQKLKLSQRKNQRAGSIRVKSKSSLLLEEEEQSITSHLSASSSASSIIIGKLFRGEKITSDEDMSTEFCHRMPKARRRSIRKSIHESRARSLSPAHDRHNSRPTKKRSASLPSTLRTRPRLLLNGRSSSLSQQQKHLRRRSRRTSRTYDDHNRKGSSKASDRHSGGSSRSNPRRRRSTSSTRNSSEISSLYSLRSLGSSSRSLRRRRRSRSSRDEKDSSNTIISDLSGSVSISAATKLSRRSGSSNSSYSRGLLVRRSGTGTRRGRSNSPSALHSYLESNNTDNTRSRHVRSKSRSIRSHRRCKSEIQHNSAYASPTSYEEALELFDWMGSYEAAPFDALASAA
jgi:hypothetical protein